MVCHLRSFEITRVTNKCRTCLTLSPHADRAGFRRGGAAAFLDRMSQSETKTGERNPVETLTCEMIYKCNLPSLSWTSTRGTNRSPGTESSQLRFLENILVYPSISLFQCTILSVGNYSKQMRSQRERSGRKELED